MILKNGLRMKKIAFLSKEFKSKRSLISKNISFDKEDKETWSTFKMISKLPRECLGAYIISMSSKASDILTVVVFTKRSWNEIMLKNSSFI